jgi:general stress protein YciG
MISCDWLGVFATIAPAMARRKGRPEMHFSAEALQFFRDMGRKGGKAGGKLRWKGVSAEERSAHAKRAVAAREAKRAAKTKPKQRPSRPCPT